MAQPLSYSVALSISTERNSGNSTPANNNLERYSFTYQGFGQEIVNGKHFLLSVFLEPLQSRTIDLNTVGVANLKGFYVKSSSTVRVVIGSDSPKDVTLFALDFPTGNLGSLSLTLSNTDSVVNNDPIEVKLIIVGT